MEIHIRSQHLTEKKLNSDHKSKLEIPESFSKVSHLSIKM